jgi:hypothetical protein
MSHLDEQAFTTAIAGCPKCDARNFEVKTYLDRQVSVMLGEANDDGRWAHDGEKFIDGVYRVTCLGCRSDAYASPDCPRCHRANGLADVVDQPPRLAVPPRCPSCKRTEVTVLGFAPARVRTGAGRPPAPTPMAGLGDAGFHVAGILCDHCDWVQSVEGCPLCGGPGPLRERP